MSQHTTIAVGRLFDEDEREVLATALEYYVMGYLRDHGLDDDDLDYSGSLSEGNVPANNDAVVEMHERIDDVRDGGVLAVTDDTNEVRAALRALDYYSWVMLESFVHAQPEVGETPRSHMDSSDRLELYNVVGVYETLAHEAFDKGIAKYPVVDPEARGE